jgi:hypothetical protein
VRADEERLRVLAHAERARDRVDVLRGAHDVVGEPVVADLDEPEDLSRGIPEIRHEDVLGAGAKAHRPVLVEARPRGEVHENLVVRSGERDGVLQLRGEARRRDEVHDVEPREDEALAHEDDRGRDLLLAGRRDDDGDAHGGTTTLPWKPDARSGDNSLHERRVSPVILSPWAVF